jgi:Cys-rich protein (TIGR01571 family)
MLPQENYAKTGTSNIEVVGQATDANKLPGYEHSPAIGQPLRDLFDCGTPFLMACCCPCVLAGQVSQKIDVCSYTTVVGTYLSILVIIIVLPIIITILGAKSQTWILWLILWGFMTVLVMTLRSRVRSMWSIEGNSFQDCCVSCCCNPCTIAQVYNIMTL